MSLDPSAECALPGAAPLRLTSFSHGGGCGCKIAPGVLSEILRSSVGGIMPKELMVGIETADDAAVYRLNDEQALIATTDFFMPIVDDPFDFGRIAATNAISDVYAMGGKPIMALALVAMPIDKLTVEQIGAVIRGGESVCREAGIPIAGGHTIDSVEPIYGLVVMGLVHPDKVRRNADAKAGDVLVLGKPIGVGVLSAALKKNALDPAGYARLIATTTRLNTPGIALAAMPGVHAITDVTGFGLAGHALEMARGAKLGVTIDWAQGAAARRRRADGGRRLRHRRLGPQLGRLRRRGRARPGPAAGRARPAHRSADLGRPAGQLRPGRRSNEVLAVFRAEGFDAAAVVGEVRAGATGPQRPGLTPARFSDLRADVGRGSGGGFFGRSDALRRRSRTASARAASPPWTVAATFSASSRRERRRGDAGARLGALGDLRREGAHQLRRMADPLAEGGVVEAVEQARVERGEPGQRRLVEHHRGVAARSRAAAPPTSRAAAPAPRR